MANVNKILIICGATASGKTALSIECAKLLDTEILSADSMNIYKNLNIGTAKPTKSEMDGVKHHLIDVIEPFEEFSVSDYESCALPIISGIFERNKTPIICGGTGFYVNSIIYDLSYGGSSANLVARQKYMQMAESLGNDAVYKILQEVDKGSAEKLHPNDLKRVVRALEIFESTGKPKSQFKDDYKLRYDYQAYAIDWDRKILYERINQRVDLMIKNGLIEEVEGLIKLGVRKENQCMQGIGYKEVFDYLTNKISKDEMIELIKLNTRHYAKRQITFFKRYKNLTFLKPSNIKTLAKEVLESFNK